MADPIEPEEEKPKPRWRRILERVLLILAHLLFISYFLAATTIFILYDKDNERCFDQRPNPTEAADTNLTVNATDQRNDTEHDAEHEETTLLPFVPYILCDINWCHGYGFLLIFFILFHIFWIYYVIFKPLIGKKLYDEHVEGYVDKWMEFRSKMLISIIMAAVAIALVVTILVFECRDDFSKTRGLLGPVFFILIAFGVSKHHKEIPWRVVAHGLIGQFVLALLCLKWQFGRSLFECMGDKAASFLSFARFGARFVYGDAIVDAFVFAFAILAVVFFFSVTTSILYYLGWMQAFLSATGFFLQATVGTTTCESVNAVGNIFLGMSESPLMIRPYIKILTVSELHTICTCGYATVAGSVLGAYISFGANPAYLITASVMAAPGALAFSKLFYPETEESRTRADNIQLEKSPDSSVLDAAASGAAAGMLMVLGIVANIIAFISLVYFFSAIVEWLFELVGHDGITILYILSKAFWPISYIMGVPAEDCSRIGLVVAEKCLINEFLAYNHLGEMIRENTVQHRSAAIATFALCGFANPGSLGILIAALSAMAPDRRGDITKVAFRAYFAGTFVSFTSASLAGILIPDIITNNDNKFMQISENDNIEHHMMDV